MKGHGYATIDNNFTLEGDLATTFQLMENTDEFLFITGRAGTGKSTLLNYFQQHTRKKFIVLAPTGLAALNVSGSTIHSFFGFPLRQMVVNDPDIKPWSKSHPRLKVLQKADVIIIDEASMVRADILNAIDESLRVNLQSDVPFAGKQLILIGDLFQLPPVESSRSIANLEEDECQSPYFFNASSFRQVLPKVIELKKIYRQADETFIFLLEKIRRGNASPDDFNDLNERVNKNSSSDFSIMLAAVNAIADKENLLKIMALHGTPQVFKASVEGHFHEKIYPAPINLQLKVGAQVMMVKNDVNGRWVNGSIGRIDQLNEVEVKVRFENGSIHTVEKVTWENRIYSWEKRTKSIITTVEGTFTQLPMKLAWAITIHKSQGLTFGNIVIDMGRGAFSHGQLYVALSRCKTLNGISLKSPIRPQDVIVDESVSDFASRHRIS